MKWLYEWVLLKSVPQKYTYVLVSWVGGKVKYEQIVKIKEISAPLTPKKIRLSGRCLEIHWSAQGWGQQTADWLQAAQCPVPLPRNTGEGFGPGRTFFQIFSQQGEKFPPTI